MTPPTRLQRAIKELHEAFGSRAWVLVFDPMHQDSENTGLLIELYRLQTPYVTVGLLEEGLRIFRFHKNEELAEAIRQRREEEGDGP